MGKRVFSSSKTSRLAVELAQVPIQRVLGNFCGVKSAGV